MRTRPVAASLPSSPWTSTCQTWVARPRCSGRAVPISVPLRTARRNEVVFSSPTVVWPLGIAHSAAPTLARASTIVA